MTSFGIVFRLILATLILGTIGLAPVLIKETSKEEAQPVLYPVALLVGADQQIMVEEISALRSASQSFLNATP